MGGGEGQSVKGKRQKEKGRGRIETSKQIEIARWVDGFLPATCEMVRWLEEKGRASGRNALYGGVEWAQADESRRVSWSQPVWRSWRHRASPWTKSSNKPIRCRKAAPSSFKT